jgi:CMP-2-keto-3-deoxyoctulosonic acid synthetase
MHSLRQPNDPRGSDKIYPTTASLELKDNSVVINVGDVVHGDEYVIAPWTITVTNPALVCRDKLS